MNKTFTDLSWARSEPPQMDDDRDLHDALLPEEDPLAIFHDMPAPQVSAGEVAAMKAAVAELRRARELARRSDELVSEVAAAAPVGRQSRRTKAPWRTAASVAALLLAALLFGGPGTAPPEQKAAIVPLKTLEGAASNLPLVEDLDPQQAELIQIEDDGMSLVVVLAAGSF